jgi:hypothetical protein
LDENFRPRSSAADPLGRSHICVEEVQSALRLGKEPGLDQGQDGDVAQGEP